MGLSGYVALKADFGFRPPRSGPNSLALARGARNCVPPKVKVARGAVTPSVCPEALICVPYTIFDYRPRVPTRPLASLMPKSPKARPRPPSRPPPPPWLPLSVATRPASQRTTLALRFESSPTLVLAGQRSRSANNGVLLPRPISPPILPAPCSCFASADRIRLRQCCLIIAVSTSPSLLGVSPVVPPSAGSVDLASVLYS